MAEPGSPADPWSAARVFGNPAGPPAILRPSAYGIVTDARGRIAVVRTPEGCFLPGGGIEAGETPDQAVEREAREECGLKVRLGAWTRHATRITDGAGGTTRYEKRSTFRDAAAGPGERCAAESDHRLEWLAPARAAEALSDASHRWAVVEWSATRR